MRTRAMPRLPKQVSYRRIGSLVDGDPRGGVEDEEMAGAAAHICRPHLLLHEGGDVDELASRPALDVDIAQHSGLSCLPQSQPREHHAEILVDRIVPPQEADDGRL